MASSAPVTLCTDPDEAEHDESSMSQANTDSQVTVQLVFVLSRLASLAYAESPVPLPLKDGEGFFLQCISIAFVPNFAYEAL